MSQCNKVLTGAKRRTYIGDFTPGCVAPVLNLDTTGGKQPEISWKLPLAASVVAPIPKGATTIALGTIPVAWTTPFIPKGFSIPFKNTDGSEGFITLSADYAGGASFTCETTGRSIKPGATFEYPVPVGGVTNAVYNPTVGSVASDGGGQNGFNAKSPGSSDGSIELTVDVSPLDVGILNFDEFRSGDTYGNKKGTLYAILSYDGGPTDYTPKIVEGGVFISAQNYPSPRNGLVSGAVTLPFVDEPKERKPIPVSP